MYDMRGNTLSRLKWLNDNLLIVKKVRKIPKEFLYQKRQPLNWFDTNLYLINAFKSELFCFLLNCKPP